MKKTFFLFLTFLVINNLTASVRLQFRNIAFKEGLNNMNVSAVVQDQLGYIWVATMGGVSRYNGYEFKHFYFDSSDPASLRSNHVFSIFCSTDGRIFIGTAIGIDCYDVGTDKLSSPFPNFRSAVYKIEEHNGYIYLGTNTGLYRFKPGSPAIEELGSNLAEKPMINTLLFDKSGNLWCGLENGRGLALYDLKTDRFDIYQKKNSGSFINDNSVRTLYQASENVILLGTKGGISSFDIYSRQFIESTDFSLIESGLSGYDIRFILQKEPSIFWIGTLQAGLFVFDKARKTLVRHFQDDGFSEIHSNNYMTYFIDKSENVWFGTFDAGLEVCFKQARNFNYDVSLNQLTQGKFITAIEEDRNNNLIIATRQNGVFVYNPENRSSVNFQKGNSPLKHSNIRTVLVDSNNNYWIGIYFGLQLYDPKQKSFKTLAIPEPNNGAVSIIQKNDRVFVGTDGQGLLIFDLAGNLLSQFLTQGINIPCVMVLNDQELLFISYDNGLFALNFNDYKVRRIELADVKKYPGLLFAINAFKDKEGKVWVGTYNYGLFSFDLERFVVRNFNIREGMPSSDAIGIEEDENGNLWVSTSYGLVRINKDGSIIKTYFLNDGLNNFQFHAKSAFKDRKNNLYFGGNLGLTYFNPSEIVQENSDAPQVVLENLYIQNLLVTPSAGKGTLANSLPFTKQITLTHHDQLFSIDFVSFDYMSPEKVQYFYMLDGFDKSWYSVGTQRKVSYSNLSRGSYTFKVKSVNHAGISSSNEAELKIIVKPAPWFSYFAWTIYISLLAGIAWFIFTLRIKNFLYKKNLEMEHSEHMREREINVMKQKFFTNISHELRTPLTLIYGLVTQLSSQDKLSPKVREFAQSLDVNVNRLLKLINQLLSFKKLESETLSLWLEKGDINEAIKRILELFSLYAREKDIRIDFQEDNSYHLWFDYDKLEKVLSNLLSNAIKHSKKGGHIMVVLTKISEGQARQTYKNWNENPVGEYIEIGVSDNGAGIDEKDWQTIFDRYKQIETDGKMLPDYSSTGIGLNFTKSLVELHKGKIKVESKVNQGTTFSFVLPCDASVFEPNDFAATSDSEDIDLSEMPGVQVQSGTPNVALIDTDFEKTVLIVEDDPQLNSFLMNVLKTYFRTINAHDGEKGLKMVMQEHPDLVISDIMMPKMDGYELTKAIKENKELCHIPVILLTAKTEVSSQIEGMHSGADLYIAKPFNVDFLISAIQSQLKNQKRLQDIFLNGQMPGLERSDINHLDVVFLSRLNSLLEKELANPDLDIQLLAKNLNMSRSVFYRKFMSLTKLSPISYIRKYRINKSVELILTGKYSLAEIAELTGFGSPSYFSTAFKQEKGIGPREYINQLKDHLTI